MEDLLGVALMFDDQELLSLLNATLQVTVRAQLTMVDQFALVKRTRLICGNPLTEEQELHCPQ